MTIHYPEHELMREARRRYFDAHGFGEDGGYSAAWVDFKLGPIPLPFPNTPGRRRAVGYHDLHHVITGYATDPRGEFEISAWELAAGCRGFVAAWILNLTALAAGVFAAPRRTFAAFVRGRRSKTLYSGDLETFLGTSVGALRERCFDAMTPVTLSDRALFGVAVAAGLLTGVVAAALMLPLVPVGIVAGILRRRSQRAEAGLKDP